jgi:hypothetical protein
MNGARMRRADGLSAKRSSSDEKGPAARRRPKAAREAYSLYVERAVEGANEADGPFSSLYWGIRVTLKMYGEAAESDRWAVFGTVLWMPPAM